MKQQFAYSAEEAYDVRVAKGISFFVAHSFEELVDPNRGIYCEAFAVESWEGRRTRARLEDGPEAVDSHLENSKAIWVLGLMSAIRRVYE